MSRRNKLRDGYRLPQPLIRPPADLREPWFVLASLGLALAAYAALSAALMPPAAESAMAERFIPELRGALLPEPGEKFLYIFGLACIATLPISFYWLLTRWNRRRPEHFAWLENPTLLWVRDAALVAGGLGWLVYLVLNSEVPWIGWWLGIAWPVGLVLLGAIWALGKWPPAGGRWLVPSVAALLALALAGLQVVGDDRSLCSPDLCHHFDLLLGAVNQVAHGRTILVDATSQYGIGYPYVAAWALWPFGLTSQGVMWFFVALVLLTLLLTYLALGHKTGAASPLTLLLFLGLIGLTFPFFTAGVFGCFASGLNAWRPTTAYYQYYPLRVVWGMLFIWYLPVYFAHKRWQLTAMGYLMAGLSLLWNSDAGAVIAIAWTATLVFDALASHAGRPGRMLAHAALHGVLLAVCVAASVGLYGLFAWARSGHFPRLEAYYAYQQIFYAAGFFMLPMNPHEFWQPIILVYVITIFHCLRRLLAKRADPTTKWYVFIALYGLGIFSYYQGRSHVFCLVAPLYPAAMLGIFLTVDLLRSGVGSDWRRGLADPRQRYAWARLALLALWPAMGLVNLVRFAPNAADYLGGEPKPPPVAAQMEPLFQACRQRMAGTPTVILSPESNYLHMQTRSYSAMPFSSPHEILLLDQIKQAQAVLDSDSARYVLIQKAPEPYLRYLRFSGFRVTLDRGNFVLLEKASR